jgi:hypothetical protein
MMGLHWSKSRARFRGGGGAHGARRQVGGANAALAILARFCLHAAHSKEKWKAVAVQRARRLWQRAALLYLLRAQQRPPGAAPRAAPAAP